MKDEYMMLLEKKLANYNKATKDAILADYEAHFSKERMAGKTDEEIIRELWDIQDLLDEIPKKDEHLDEKKAAEVAFFENAVYENKGFQEIVIETDSVDLVVLPSIDDKIHLDLQVQNEEERENYHCYQYEKNGRIYLGVIEEGKQSHIIPYPIKKIFANRIWGHHSFQILEGGSLTVLVPEELQSVQTKTQSGNLTFRDQKRKELIFHSLSGEGRVVSTDMETLTIHSLSGDFLLQQVNGGRVYVDTTSGDQSIWDVNVQCCDTRSNSGDIIIKNLHCDQLITTTSSGDLESNRIFGRNWEGKSSSGNINGHEIHMETVTLGTSSGDFDIYTDATRASFIASSGDIKAEIAGNPKDIQVVTRSGDSEIILIDVPAGMIKLVAGSGDLMVNLGGVIKKGENHMLQVKGPGAAKITGTTGSGDCKIITK